MMIIDQLNFAEMYQQHMKQANRSRKDPIHWDQKAEKMATTVFNPQDCYLQDFQSLMNFNGAQSILDVGCGPGSVCLSIADKFQKIIGIDYSQGMLDVAQKRADSLAIHHAEFHCKAWEDDWSDLPQVDIAVASRSTLVMDLKTALLKLNRQALARVYTTHRVNPTFIDTKILQAIGREVIGLPTYIYAVNILQQLGINPQVNYIRGSQNSPEFANFDDFVESINRSLKDLTALEKEKLHHYYAKCCQSNQPVAYSARDWAMVAWEVVDESELHL